MWTRSSPASSGRRRDLQNRVLQGERVPRERVPQEKRRSEIARPGAPLFSRLSREGGNFDFGFSLQDFLTRWLRYCPRPSAVFTVEFSAASRTTSAFYDPNENPTALHGIETERSKENGQIKKSTIHHQCARLPWRLRFGA